MSDNIEKIEVELRRLKFETMCIRVLIIGLLASVLIIVFGANDIANTDFLLGSMFGFVGLNILKEIVSK